MKKRLDVWLVEKNLAPSRAKAQELIDEGCVVVEGKTSAQITAALQLDSELSASHVQVDPSLILRFVSRAGRKLESYLVESGLSFKDLDVLDLGQSTGGFTDCALRYGAKLVVGIDVGRDQLHPSLKGRPEVHAFEGLHLKDLVTHNEFQSLKKASAFDIVVCDLSFISTLAHLDLILPWAPRALLLIKPQFELGAKALNKKGLVQNDKMISDLELRLATELRGKAWALKDWRRSGLTGKDGNQEYFAYVEKVQSGDA